jgi:hypothetical protein
MIKGYLFLGFEPIQSPVVELRTSPVSASDRRRVRSPSWSR